MNDGLCPFLGCLGDGQVNDLGCRLFAGKNLSVSNHLANHAVDAFDGIGGVDRFADLRRILEHRGDVFPVSVPALRNHRISVVPGISEFGQGRFSGLQGRRLVDRFQVTRDCLAVLETDKVQCISHQMDDAQLNLGLRENTFNGFRESAEPIDTGDEDILDSSVAQIIEDV